MRLATPAAQLGLINALRPRIGTFEFVFEDGGEVGHPLIAALAELSPAVGAHRGVRHGYDRTRAGTTSFRYRYHRSVVRALAELGGLFVIETDAGGFDQLRWSRLGNVDLVLRGERGDLLGYTITHEGLVFVRKDLLPAGVELG